MNAMINFKQEFTNKHIFAGIAVIAIISISIYVLFVGMNTVIATASLIPNKFKDKFDTNSNLDLFDLTEYNKELKQFKSLSSEQQTAYLKMTREEKLLNRIN